MDSEWSHQSSQQWKHSFSRPSLLRHPFAWRRARRLERVHRSNDQRLAWRVQDVIVGCGLSQDDYSVGGGRVFHIPQVLSVSHGPPVSLDIRMLQGQRPEDFAAHASAMAYDLGVAEVRVIPLDTPLIQLQLLSIPTHQANVRIGRVGQGLRP
ncbi:MAG: hypothetical protein JO296_13800 [Pseudonocardiales bacterium]|nr:hypothetical protein [Pseudonocardiales bacterium]MBV9651193.1 hypothetical protein [Pseudonocardiales bacterium]